MEKLFITLGCIFLIMLGTSVSCYSNSASVPISDRVLLHTGHPAKPYVYCSNTNSLNSSSTNIITKINATDGSVVTGTASSKTYAMSIYNNKLFVHEVALNRIEVFDDETLELRSTITIPANSRGMVVGGGYVFIASGTSVYSYSITTGLQAGQLSVGSAFGSVTLSQGNDPQSGLLCYNYYSSSYYYYYLKYDSSGKMTLVKDLGSKYQFVPLQFSPDGNFLYTRDGNICNSNPFTTLKYINKLQYSDAFGSNSRMAFDINGSSKLAYYVSENSKAIFQYSYPSHNLTGEFSSSNLNSIIGIFYTVGKLVAVTYDKDYKYYFEIIDLSNNVYTNRLTFTATPTTTALKQENGRILVDSLTVNFESVSTNNSIYAITTDSILYKYDYTNLTQTALSLPIPKSDTYSASTAKMATYNGDIYVACTARGAVYRFDGNTLERKGSGLYLSPNISVADMEIGNDGNLYILSGNGVYSYSRSTGNQISSYMVASIHDMAFSPAENIIYLFSSENEATKLLYNNGNLSFIYKLSLSGNIYSPTMSSDGKYIYGISSSGVIFNCTADPDTDLKTKTNISQVWVNACFDPVRNVFYTPSSSDSDKKIAIVDPSLGNVTGYYNTKFPTRGHTHYENKLIEITHNNYTNYGIEIFDPSTYFAPNSNTLEGTSVDSILNIDNITKAISVEDTFYVIDRPNWKLHKIDYVSRTKTEIILPFEPNDVLYNAGNIYVGFNNYIYVYNATTLAYVDKFPVGGFIVSMVIGHDGYLYLSDYSKISSYSLTTKKQVAIINCYADGMLYLHPTENILYYSNGKILRGQVKYNNGVFSELSESNNSYGNSLIGLLPSGDTFLNTYGNIVTLQTTPYVNVQTLRNIGGTASSNNLAFNPTGYVYFGDEKKLYMVDRNPYYQKGSFTTNGDINWVFTSTNSLYAITNQSGVYHIEKFDPSEAQWRSIVDITGINDLQYNVSYGGSTQLNPVVQFSDGTSMNIKDTATYASSDTSLVTVDSGGYLAINYVHGLGTANVSINFAEFTKQIKVSIISTIVDIITSKGSISHYFDVNTKTYTVSLPYGTTTVPKVEGITYDITLSIEVIPAITLRNYTIIIVRDSLNQLVDSYTVNFSVRTSLESDHPYKDMMDETQTYVSKTPCNSISVTFSSDTYVENRYDYIFITDVNGNNVSGSPFTGYQLAGKTIKVPGTVVNIRLTSDQYTTGYGYKVTNIVENDGIITIKDSNGIDVTNLASSDNAMVSVKVGDSETYVNDTNTYIAYYNSNGVLLSCSLITQQYVDDSNILYFKDTIHLNNSVKKIKVFYWKKVSKKPISMRELN